MGACMCKYIIHVYVCVCVCACVCVCVEEEELQSGRDIHCAWISCPSARRLVFLLYVHPSLVGNRKYLGHDHIPAKFDPTLPVRILGAIRAGDEFGAI